jgi:protein sidekick
MELPYPPSSVKAERDKTAPKGVLLSWAPAFDGNSRLTGYILQRREVPVTGEWVPVNVTGELSY